MDIGTTEKYCNIIYRLLELSPRFERALNIGDMPDDFKNFMIEDLENVYTNLSELKEDIDHIGILKRLFTKIHFLDNIITFIYSTLIKSCKTNKIKGIPMSKSFLMEPMSTILTLLVKLLAMLLAIVIKRFKNIIQE